MLANWDDPIASLRSVKPEEPVMTPQPVVDNTLVNLRKEIANKNKPVETGKASVPSSPA